MDTNTELVVEALRARAGQRERAGGLLAEKLTELRAGGQDVRSRALKVVDELAAATSLKRIADQIEDGTLVVLDKQTAARAAATAAAAAEVPLEPVGDRDELGAAAEAEARALRLVDAGEDDAPKGETLNVDGIEVEIIGDDDAAGADDVAAALAAVDAAAGASQ